MTVYAGGDKLGANFTFEDGDYVSGTWTNVGKFYIPSGVTVFLTPYADSSTGMLELEADSIIIDDIINAIGAGWGGGGGGGGAGGPKVEVAAGDGGEGGVSVQGSIAGSNGETPTLGAKSGVSGGDGGAGGGSFGGAGGDGGDGGDYSAVCNSVMNGSDGVIGSLGGYAGVGINGDSSTDESVDRGSGGGGAGGGGSSGAGPGYTNGSGGGGGASGGGGGGSIKLTAKYYLRINGAIYTKGTNYGGDGGEGQVGSNAESCDGGSGGAYDINGSTYLGGGESGHESCGSVYAGDGEDGSIGAGGGICLICNGPFGIDIQGTLDTRGGGNSEVNIGSTKIFRMKNAGDISGATMNTGWNDVFGTPYTSEGKNWVHVC